MIVSVRAAPSTQPNIYLAQGGYSVHATLQVLSFGRPAGAGVTVTRSILTADAQGNSSAAVLDSAETVADGSYPLSRSLYIYVNAANAAENPALASYVDYFLSDGITAVEEAGYVALPEDRLAESRAAWEGR